ncbi:MAG: hypothetical protein NXH88_19620, partial [Hyphomonas sp.]|nr:hypothetical protein [Hyphomonas sp.]
YGGARDDLYPADHADAYLEAAIAAGAARKTESLLAEHELFVEECNRMRFIERSEKRTEVREDLMPLPLRDTPDLSGQNVYSVTTLPGLARMLSDADTQRLAALSVRIPLDGNVVDAVAFREALELLDQNDLTFELDDDGGLGRFVLWFTTEDALLVARDRSVRQSDPLPLAECLRSVNGLGHRMAGEWFVLLTIPGAAIQRAGHYRPVFCDGGAGPDTWFMGRSSHPARYHGGPWGQTCHLEALQEGAVVYDGAVERVAIQPRHAHFQAERIRFEILEPVFAKFGDSSALSRLSDGIWARKDA